MKFKRKHDPYRRRLKKKAKRGYRGEPVATIAYYGPTDKEATKVATAIVEDGEVVDIQRWILVDGDIRYDAATNKAVYLYLQEKKPRSLVMLAAINGCPHEEGIDYPEGEDCPHCPFWAGRRRPTDELRDDLATVDQDSVVQLLTEAKRAPAPAVAAEEEE